jgi:ubiquinone/menaquinone biosynthesis C-methylase UbiE
MSYYGRTDGNVLELGSFSGGITIELAGCYPGLELTIADENPAYIRYLYTLLTSAGLSGRIRLIDSNPDALVFDDESFDLVILRGAFFFIMDRPAILKEIYRVLKPLGTAFVGGGYGKGVPQAIIDEIADESRVLNDSLGRRRVTIAQLQKILEVEGLSERAEIVEEGGVWIIMRKP